MREDQKVTFLIAGCLHQDEASQMELYRHFYSYGMSICLRYARSKESAMEMLNELLSFERMRLITKQSFVDQFKKILPAKKVARFFQIENKMEAIINFDLARQIPLVQ